MMRMRGVQEEYGSTYLLSLAHEVMVPMRHCTEYEQVVV